jgi:SAM-dependent methyltransferase
MDYVQHVLWPGRRDLRGIRVLDAGCGTGHTALAIARRYPEIEVVGIDLSEAALATAQAQARRLRVGSNLTLRQLAIEEAGQLDGQFDYVVASGVLHHLEDPATGLQALADLLTPWGGLGIMVYGTYGRQGVYMVQDLIRRLAGTQDLTARVAMTRELLTRWPPYHPFAPGRCGELGWEGNVGLVDLLLHAHDQSFTVPEIFDWLEGARLRLERFYDPPVYNPLSYLTQPGLAGAAAALPTDEQAALAELLHGRMVKHMLFATRATYEPPRVNPRGLQLLPLRPRRSPLFDWKRATARRGQPDEPLVVREHPFDVLGRSLRLESWQARVIGECDGERTARQILDLPEIKAGVPGHAAHEKLLVYVAFVEYLAAQLVLLLEP